MLRCEECDQTAAEFRQGWCSFYAHLPDEAGRPHLVTYCVDCAKLDLGSMAFWLGASAAGLEHGPGLEHEQSRPA